MTAIRVPLGSLLVDHNRLSDVVPELLVINEIPQEDETGVPLDAIVYMTAVCIQAEAINRMQVWIADLGDTGVLELAYDLNAGGFQAGYSGTASLQASPGSGVNDELALAIARAARFTSQSSIRVEVYVTTAMREFRGAYNFTTVDETAPQIENVVWLSPRRARVMFDEAMDVSTSLACTFADEGVEILDELDVQLLTQTPQASWVGMWAGLTGSIYPSNNGYRPVLGINAALRTVRLGSETDLLVPDTGIDLSDQGAVLRDRKLRLSISPYRLLALLLEEAAAYTANDPERVQCAYEPIVVSVNAPQADEIPIGDNASRYAVVDFHDDISIGRLYRFKALGVKDALGNTAIDPGALFDFLSPTFGYPADRISLADLLPEEYWDEDMLNEQILRSIIVVLQDLFNQMWSRVEEMQYYHDADRCPDRLLPFLLHHRGNPFRFPIDTEHFQRRVADGLDQMKRIVGTETGIEDIIRLLLPDVPCDVRPYLTSYDGWIMDESILSYTTVLAPGSPYYRNSYEIVAPFALTEEQLRIVVDAARWADPVNAHLIRVLEPSDPGYDTVFWVMNISALNFSTRLKQGI